MIDPRIRLLYYLFLKTPDKTLENGDIEATVVWVTHRLRGSFKQINDNRGLIWSILKELTEESKGS